MCAATSDPFNPAKIVIGHLPDLEHRKSTAHPSRRVAT